MICKDRATLVLISHKKAYKSEEIFVSTEDDYVNHVREQAPDIPKTNIIAEPERKDLLGACGLVTTVVNKYFPGETVLISWAKHLIARESVFLDAIEAAALTQGPGISPIIGIISATKDVIGDNLVGLYDCTA